jgi:DNA repair protein RadA/Sms
MSGTIRGYRCDIVGYMAKVKTVFVCQSCSAQYSRWQGQCTQCQGWNTLVEELSHAAKAPRDKRRSGVEGRLVRWEELEKKGVSEIERFSTGSAEFDRVLGGGLVPGSVVLIAGEPGMGKSTLLTQLALRVGQPDFNNQETRSKQLINSNVKKYKKNTENLEPSTSNVLYICGEESIHQVGMRVRRLATSNQQPATSNNLTFLPSTDVDVIVETARKEKPRVMIVDSIQTVSTEDLSGMAGSVGQVRESAARLVRVAKEEGIATCIVGHVTKEGTVAGPKVLEHMVDAVVEITGERSGMYRLLRNLKNRFGATDEVGVLMMEEQGLLDVANPSSVFLEETQVGVPGRAVVVVMEGLRPVLVEVQALAVPSQLAQPRRVAQGVSLAKVQVLLAVLQKWCRLPTHTHDVFVSVVGGLKLNDPGADLGMALALASSVKGKALPQEVVAVGEVGLLGEIRKVPSLAKRVQEASRLGYTQVLAPPAVLNMTQAVKELLG